MQLLCTACISVTDKVKIEEQNRSIATCSTPICTKISSDLCALYLTDLCGGFEPYEVSSACMFTVCIHKKL